LKFSCLNCNKGVSLKNLGKHMKTECSEIQYSTVHKPAGIYDEM